MGIDQDMAATMWKNRLQMNTLRRKSALNPTGPSAKCLSTSASLDLRNVVPSPSAILVDSAVGQRALQWVAIGQQILWGSHTPSMFISVTENLRSSRDSGRDVVAYKSQPENLACEGAFALPAQEPWLLKQ